MDFKKFSGYDLLFWKCRDLGSAIAILKSIPCWKIQGKNKKLKKNTTTFLHLIDLLGLSLTPSTNPGVKLFRSFLTRDRILLQLMRACINLCEVYSTGTNDISWKKLRNRPIFLEINTSTTLPHRWSRYTIWRHGQFKMAASSVEFWPSLEKNFSRFGCTSEAKTMASNLT